MGRREELAEGFRPSGGLQRGLARIVGKLHSDRPLVRRAALHNQEAVRASRCEVYDGKNGGVPSASNITGSAGADGEGNLTLSNESEVVWV